MIDFSVTGTEAVAGYLRSLPIRIANALSKAMEREMISLVRYVKEEKLSGQVLKNRTGTLRRKINYQINRSSAVIEGIVGVKLAYAAVHEYGIDKVVNVKPYSRQMNIAWGRRVALPRKIEVVAHQRHMKLPERSYLRSSLRELSPKIMTALNLAVAQAVA